MQRLTQNNFPELYLTETQKFFGEVENAITELRDCLQELKTRTHEKCNDLQSTQQKLKQIHESVKLRSFKRTSLKSQFELVIDKIRQDCEEFKVSLDIPDLLAVRVNQPLFRLFLRNQIIRCLDRGAYHLQIYARLNQTKDKIDLSIHTDVNHLKIQIESD